MAECSLSSQVIGVQMNVALREGLLLPEISGRASLMNTVNNEGFLTSSVNTSVNVVFLPGQFYDTGNGATSCFFFFLPFSCF